jgi:hypothetical protein
MNYVVLSDNPKYEMHVPTRADVALVVTDE